MVSLTTALMLQGNETRIITTAQRHEIWSVKRGQPHALLISCPLDKLAELQEFLEEIKQAGLLKPKLPEGQDDADAPSV